MSRLNLATSTITNKPLDYFCEQLNISREELDWIIERTNPITKEDTNEEPMSEIDLDLMTLLYHMRVCYDKSIPSSKPMEGMESNVQMCNMDTSKKVNFICGNLDCPMKLFSMKFRKDHKKQCSRPEMINTKQFLEQTDFYEEYYDIEESVINDKMNKIETLGQEMKDIFGSYIDIMMKHWKNEILCTSREPMCKHAKEKLKEKIKIYDGKVFITTN